MRLLALDTATERCSAALWLDGELLTRAAQRPRGHGELILPMIDALLAEGGLRLSGLDAIAYGCGPGAFTGVRLAVCVSQGLAFASDLPVLPISDLRAVAQRALAEADAPPCVLVCQDARMGEVYWAGFERRNGFAAALSAEQLGAPGTFELPFGSAFPAPVWSAAGSGFAAYPALADKAAAAQLRTLSQLLPDAREVALLAAHDGLAAALSPEAAQPVYLRNNVAAVPSQN